MRGEKDKARITGLIIESVFKPFVILNHFGFITHPELGTATRGHLESAESLIERVYNGFDDHQKQQPSMYSSVCRRPKKIVL